MYIYIWLNHCPIVLPFIGGERRCTRNASLTCENGFLDVHYHDYHDYHNYHYFIFFTYYLLLLDETDPSCICDVNLCSGLREQKKSEMFKYSNVAALFLCGYTH